jgi:hypothetical protein
LLVSFSILHKHASVLTPSMFMAHDPQIPSRQDRRKVSVGSTSFLILICGGIGDMDKDKDMDMEVGGWG